MFGDPAVFKDHEVVPPIAHLFQSELVVGCFFINTDAHRVKAVASVFIDPGLVFFDFVLLFEQGNEFTAGGFKIDFMEFFLNFLRFAIRPCQVGSYPFLNVFAFSDIEDISHGIVQIVDSCCCR